MIRRLAALVVLLAAVAAAGGWILSAPAPLTASALPNHEPDTDNGRYMFFAGGCASCHATPEADDRFALGGGLRLETPFGVFVAPNISPDETDGIGGWSTLDFVNAMMRGVSPDGAHYYPSFPYTSYARMRMEDVIDLKAFLDTLDPVEGRAPDHELGFPYSIRRGLGLWKRLHLSSDLPDTGGDDPVIARGRYLTEGPGHCGECHTPRDWTGGLDHARAYAGAAAAEGEGRVPNVTPHEDGIADWSAGDIAYALESGFTPEFDVLGSTMGKVIDNTSELTRDDRDAIAAYLKALPPLPHAR